MPKRIPYIQRQVLRAILKEVRLAAPMTQLQLARKLGKPQNFVSKYERGEKRLDVLELREICGALGTTLSAFVKRLEIAIAKEGR